MSQSAEQRSRVGERVVLLVLLLAVLYLAFRVIRPYLDPILIAILITPLVHPIFRWLRDRLRGRASAAALLTCLLVVLVILGPLALLGIGLVNQGTQSVAAVQAWVEAGNLDEFVRGDWAERFKSVVGRTVPLLDPDRIDLRALLLSFSNRVGNLLLSKGTVLLSGTGAVLLNLVLMLFLLFFTVRDGEEILRGIREHSPLRTSQEERLLARFLGVSRAALLGAFGTAVVQGLAGGIGLWIAGIPALFWGTIIAFASLIPLVGTAVVWVPACVYLLLAGRPGMALFLAIWSILVVGTIDNFVRPILMRGESEMSTVWIFFAVLGGLQLFGLPGLFYGPLIFGLVAVMLYLYRVEFGEFLEQQAHR